MLRQVCLRLPKTHSVRLFTTPAPVANSLPPACSFTENWRHMFKSDREKVKEIVDHVIGAHELKVKMMALPMEERDQVHADVKKLSEEYKKGKEKGKELWSKAKKIYLAGFLGYFFLDLYQQQKKSLEEERRGENGRGRPHHTEWHAATTMPHHRFEKAALKSVFWPYHAGVYGVGMTVGGIVMLINKEKDY